MTTTSERSTYLGADKRAETVARAIEDRIVDLGWPVGLMLGSEQSLMAEYDASRGVLREAVRLLEHHGTARMRRGPGGGLVVQPARSQAVRRSAALFLQFQRTELRALIGARTALELDCLELVADRITDPEVSRYLARTLSDTADLGTDQCVSFHQALADLCGNPALGLFTRILLELNGELVATHDHPSDPEPVLLEPAASQRVHQQIFESLVAGNLDAARQVLTWHLDEVAAMSLAVAAAEQRTRDLPA